MTDPDELSGGDPEIPVRHCRTLREAEQYALVLTAVGIGCSLVPTHDRILVTVSASDATRARRELQAYDEENPSAKASRVRPVAVLVEGPMAYAAVLLFFFAATRREAFGIDWLEAGAAQAGLILDGAWWRTVTALTLHADFGHLLGNLLLGIVAASLLAQLLGTGLAWLGIVLAGTFGNAVNALIHTPEHTSIGASTAVFAALGLLAGTSQRTRLSGWRRGLRRWSPVAAGLMLVAFLGIGGERTDVTAHIAGFAVGGLAGFALGQVSSARVFETRLQWVCAMSALAIIALAWLLAVVAR